MNYRIGPTGPTVKHEWNVAMHMLPNFLEFVVNTTAYHYSQYRLHLFLKSLMAYTKGSFLECAFNILWSFFEEE